MNRFILSLELIDSPLLLVSAAVAVLGLIAVIVWPHRRLVLTLSIGVAAGIVMFVIAKILEAMDTFQGPLPGAAIWWASGAVAAIAVGIVGIFRSPRVRRVAGVVTVISALLAGILGVNTAYGVTHNLAAILGVQALDPASLPQQSAAAGDPATLYRTWQPPADMPAKGSVSALTGSTKIPTGQYAARDASLYLPPAAQVANPPALPLLVFMMGQPGSPDPTSLAKALDTFAAANNGLAPIAIVVDQLTAPDLDPSCVDSAKYGAVATYINQLVPQWAEQNLNIVKDRHYWTIGGFSNGGSCAAMYGSRYPETWGQMLDVMGNEFPGSEHVAETVADVYNGDAAAFQSAKPSVIMGAAPAGTYTGHTAIFTWGSADTTYGPGQLSNSQAADAAGFTTLTYIVEGGGHTGETLDASLAWAIPALAPTLGLAAPPS
ncbi:enterochelin esterase-like enzyme [Microbacterium proteolyticum]|uniref:Enterochelin esterase-like enzyme n=1 Tax=Microbacterium proteolyticum TaxID=1572644 RepID=A0A7W5CFD4_9MICO|nr:esterase [Microbacterium proteolyticum]MBB3156695.1 enterochelin esterase-like enzyme [Microbacterium proteolyticum]